MIQHSPERHIETNPKTRFIFITGGVVSSLGKGIAAASIGRLLVARGLTCRAAEVRPLHQRRPGHDVALPARRGVRDRGRRGDRPRPRPLRAFHRRQHQPRLQRDGRWRSTTRSSAASAAATTWADRQVVPHITDEIKQRIALIAQSTDVDFVITEIGGTVGDIESLPFLEAIRQFPVDVGRRRCMFIHLTLVPYIGHAGELKTKPTQHSVNELRRIGIAPDMLMCRSEGSLSEEIRKKIALFASLPSEASSRPATSTTSTRCRSSFATRASTTSSSTTSAWRRAPDLSSWQEPIERAEHAKRTVRIALVGKYVELEDAYLSVSEALRHAAALKDARVQIDWVDSESLEERRRARRTGRRAHERASCCTAPTASSSPGIRRARDRGQDRRRADRTRAAHSVPGHLPRDADRGRGVRAARRGHGGRQLDRVRPRDALSGDRPAARAEGGRRPRRHDAPRRRSDQAARRHARTGNLRRGGHLRAPPPPL